MSAILLVAAGLTESCRFGCGGVPLPADPCEPLNDVALLLGLGSEVSCAGLLAAGR